MPRTSASANSTGKSQSTPSRGTSTSTARQSSSKSTSTGTTRTSTSSTSAHRNHSKSSHGATGVRQGPNQQPKCNTTIRNDTDSLISSFSQLRLNDHVSKGRKEGTEKTSYEVARKKTPSEPGIYKMYRKDNNKEVYIGHSIDLKRRINNHQYGSQVVDQFLRKESDNVEVKVELSPTKDDARVREKKELEAFKKQYDRLPEFNRRM